MSLTERYEGGSAVAILMNHYIDNANVQKNKSLREVHLYICSYVRGYINALSVT